MTRHENEIRVRDPHREYRRGIAFALPVSGDPVPYLSVGTYAPILVGALILAVTTQLGAGSRTIALDLATTRAAP
ncbi:hypothetical protein [Dactylosporangium sp. NPDC051541]|uniref:hypothetical protein n=1 Tax=Dactylosporangium sp. NPDC051541 TaxID=3363977 RepID=UPI00378EB0F8